jgi:Cytochrome P460
MKYASVVLVWALLMSSAFATESAAHSRTAASLNDHELLLPSDYRSWVALSPAASGMPAHQHHHVISKVYVEPTAYQGFVKHGAWPNQTVIVLELSNDQAPATTKCNLMGLEVAVKDDSRTPDPWTYYGIIYDHQRPTAAPATTESICKDCGEVDSRLAMYFPALRAVIHAKPWMVTPSIF